MKYFRAISSLLLVIIGLAVGLYVGLWFCFIGGIADLYDMIFKHANSSGTKVAIDIVKIFFSGFLGYLSAFLFIVPGMSLVGMKLKD